ncbi:phage tail tape measure protein [Actinocrispum wychmicini]|uniref:TP901 family phage tail tape measure protein n=1 Tax=Actinocrispum wychmicini TaxID=1213861 RepID=A0A4R2JJD6_9PSEU|nr:phage tail tape measure protein [Actinocrispum wychmicini]TCO57118.1 TP901 family phage tail tape measure protein [Actinocrispum wychmicini]
MADAIPPVVLRFVATTTEAVGEVRLFAKSFTDAGAAVKATATEMSAAVGQMGERVGAEAKTVAAENNKVAASFQKTAEAAARSNEEIYVSMQAMRSKTVGLLADLEAAEAKAAAATEEMSVKMGTSAEAAAAKQDAAVGKVVKGVGLAAGIIAGVSLKMAGAFEQSTNKLVTSAGESEDGLKTVRTGILNLAGDVGVSATEMSAAMYKVESAGYHAEAGLGVLKAAEQGAKAEGAEGVEVADALSSALRDYYPHAQSAADVTKAASDTMSKFIGATSSGKMTFDELAGSLNSILPVASAAKISMSDVLGVLASMTVHGISAQQATQNMADAIRHLQAPTQVMSKAMASLGIDSDDVKAKLGERGLSGTMNLLSQAVKKAMPPGSDKVIIDLGDALSKSTPKVKALGQELMSGAITMGDYQKATKGLDAVSAGQAASFATMVKSTHQLGTEQLSGGQVMNTYGGMMQKLMGDATGLKVALMTTGENADYTADAIKAIGGSAADADGNVKGWSEVQNTLNQKLADAEKGTQSLAIKIGSVLLPVASHIAGVIADVTKWLSNNEWAAKTLAITIGGVLVGALAAGVGKMISWVSNLDSTAKGVAGATVKLGLLAAGFDYGISHMDTWQGKAVLVVTALSGIGTAVNGLSGPLGSLGSWFANQKGAFGNFVSDMGAAEGAMGKIKTAGKGVLDFLSGPWGIALGLAIGAVALFSSGNKDANKAVDDLTRAIKDDGDALGQNTRAWTVNKLEKDDAFGKAKQLGISEGELTNALMSQGSALDDLKTKLQGIIQARIDLDQKNNQGSSFSGRDVREMDSTGTAAQLLLKELEGLTGQLNASKDAADRQSSALHQSADHLDAVALGAIKADGSTGDLVSTSKKAADAMDAEKNEAKLLTDQLDLLNGGNIDATKATVRYKDSVDAAALALKDNGRSLDMNNDKGRKNISAILDAVTAAQDHAKAVAQQTHSVEAGNKAFADDVAALQAVLAKAGLTKDQIQELTNKYMQVPKDISTNVTADTSQAENALGRLYHDLGALNPMMDRIGAKTNKLRAHGGLVTYAHGGLAHFGPGGPVSGRGSDTSDDIPAMLSNTEYVQQASAVRAAGVQVMDAMNRSDLRGAYRMLGDRIGAGAQAVAVPVGGGGVTVNVYTNALLSTKAEIKSAVQEAFLQNGMRNVQNGLTFAAT